MNKKLMTLVFGLLLLVGLTACGGNGEEAKKDNKKNNGPAAVVNGEEIPRKEFEKNYDMAKSQYEQMGMDLKGKEKQIKKSVVDQMIDSELLVQYAKDSGIKVDDNKVDEEYKKFTDQFEKEEQMDKFLKQNNLKKDELKPLLKESLMVQKYIDENTEEPKVSEEELKKQYDQYVEQQKQMQKQAEKKAEESGQEGQQQQEIPEYEEMKDSLKQQMVQSKKDEQVQKLVQELRDDSEIEVNV
ncbi:SurA N-terminal domain-containing protein [Thalassobacillus hwangdonensis]|uniref:SurA N-terminal domain-containing protein n=1 Tax=Thalassobacillus hwangdonensis TaxID=546108 RepID=A0ABW3KZW8_9BACI